MLWLRKYATLVNATVRPPPTSNLHQNCDPVPMSFKRNFLASCLAGLLVSGIQTIPAQIVVQIGQNFTGSTYGANSQSLPPDSNGAIGPRHFMEFINGAVAVYNKTNGVAVQRKSNLKFWSDAGVIISPDSVVTDPRVIYDSSAQRWFASQVDANGTAADPTLEANDFLFAVSATADPTGRWHGFLFQADPDSGYFAWMPLRFIFPVTSTRDSLTPSGRACCQFQKPICWPAPPPLKIAPGSVS